LKFDKQPKKSYNIDVLNDWWVFSIQKVRALERMLFSSPESQKIQFSQDAPLHKKSSTFDSEVRPSTRKEPRIGPGRGER
jgi:hypothetical protein